MRVLGKRPVYLLALLVFIAANAWSARAGSWGSLLGGRVVSGFGAAVAEMLGVGQGRGLAMMGFHGALVTGVFLGQMAMAWIIQRWSWRVSCEALAIAGGVLWVLVFFLIRETQYPLAHPRSSGESGGGLPQRRAYRQWLSLCHGYHHSHPFRTFFQTLRDLLFMIAYPPVIWTGCLSGVFVGWIIVLLVTVAKTFGQPPYSWHLGNAGLLSIAGWIGTLPAIWAGGILIDRLISPDGGGRSKSTSSLLSLKPSIDESSARAPESRLPALILPFLIASVGLIILAFTLLPHPSDANKGSAWVAPALGLAFHTFGFASTSNIAVTFAVDCYPTLGGEAMVTVFVLRNIIALICSFESAPWIQTMGIKRASGVMAGVEWGLLLLGIVFWRWNGRILRCTGCFGPGRRVRLRQQAESAARGSNTEMGSYAEA